MLPYTIRWGLLLLIGFATSLLAETNNKLTLYSYHQTPPFITGTQTGLTYDFANYLSRKHQGLKIEVIIIPRKRLDRVIETSPKNIIIPWVSPVWFSPKVTDQFSWSNEMMPDASIYIWNNNTVYRFHKPQDLIGYNLGGIRGYRYINIDPLVEEKYISRNDSSNEKQLLQMLLQKRIDVGIIPFSAAQYLMQEHGLENEFNLSSHHQFSRKLMIASSSPSIETQLMKTISTMEQDLSWQKVMQKYGLITHPKTLRQATR